MRQFINDPTYRDQSGEKAGEAWAMGWVGQRTPSMLGKSSQSYKYQSKSDDTSRAVPKNPKV